MVYKNIAKKAPGRARQNSWGTEVTNFAQPRAHTIRDSLCKAQPKGGPQVACMLQASPGRSAMQQHQQNSPNLGPAF